MIGLYVPCVTCVNHHRDFSVELVLRALDGGRRSQSGVAARQACDLQRRLGRAPPREAWRFPRWDLDFGARNSAIPPLLRGRASRLSETCPVVGVAFALLVEVRLCAAVRVPEGAPIAAFGSDLDRTEGWVDERRPRHLRD